MPPHVLVDFVVLPPGHGRSVTYSRGWDAHEAQLRCPDVSGDIGGWSARGAFKPKSKLNINHLTPNDPYRGSNAPLTSKCCILYIYSTNIVTEYFKRGIYSPLFPLQKAVGFIMLTYLVPVLFKFYIQGVLKLKKNSGAKRLKYEFWKCAFC